MDFSSFKNDEEIIQYLEDQLEKIHILNECRLYKEEQLQLSEEVLWFRNCIEWIIRSNQVIINIQYALTKSLIFAKAISCPLEETENKRLYSYYLEDAVYRTLVLWDMYRQLLNEFYKCGYMESDNVSIFKFIKEKKSILGDSKVNKILNHLNSQDHKMVRETLRNSFTHSIDATSSFVFHQKVNGRIQPKMDYIMPNHPYENLNYVIIDVLKLIDLLKETVNEMYEHRNNDLILLEVTTVMPCGKEIHDSEYWSLRILKQRYEQIVVSCETTCEKINTYNHINVCRPTKVNYQRIHSKEETSGTLTPTMTFAEIEAAFCLNKEH